MKTVKHKFLHAWAIIELYNFYIAHLLADFILAVYSASDQSNSTK